MARPKAKECDKCAHYRFGFDASRCAKGHSPRFYSMGRYTGWRRVCEDFEARAGEKND